MSESHRSTRRNFLRLGLAAGSALSIARPSTAQAGRQTPSGNPSSRIALAAGDDRAGNVYEALQPFRDDLVRAIGDRRVVLKPNNVLIDNQLAATHADCLEGILEFLKEIGIENVVIAESAANGSTLDGFENYGYLDLSRRYRVSLVDLDQESFDLVHVFDQTDFRPRPVRMSSLLLNRRDNFVVSVAKFKSHDRVVATLSLKNIVFGAPIKDRGFTWDSSRTPGSKSDKHIPHGSGFRAINYNLFDLADRLHPSFAVIDGYRGMEGDGPNYGTPVEHRVALAGFDWLAADRVAVELMGIDFAKVGYLNFCAQAGMGEADLSRIDVLGERISDHARTYKLNKNIDQQFIWLQPAQVV